MSNTGASIDASIAAAVEAKIHAQVFEALAGDEVIGRYVMAALQRPIEVEDPGTYRKRRTTWLAEALSKTIRAAAESAVAEAIEAEKEAIRKEVAKALRAQASELAGTMVDSLAETVKNGWRVNVKFEGNR